MGGSYDDHNQHFILYIYYIIAVLPGGSGGRQEEVELTSVIRSGNAELTRVSRSADLVGGQHGACREFTQD